MKEEIKRTIIKYKENLPKTIYERELEIMKMKFDKAVVIIGPRRAGKSYYLYKLAKEKEDSIIINFEDALINNIKKDNLSEITECSKELFGPKNFIFYFDEIQNVLGWENFIVSLLNEHNGVFITGSNSRFLSKEIATALRGKAIGYLMLPFSFNEYLKVKKVQIEKNLEYKDKIFEIKKHFNCFMKEGGFPEIVLSDSLELKNKIINNYRDSVLYKDLVDRLNLKNIDLVEVTMSYIMNLFGNIFSISKFEEHLKSNKIKYSLEDIYRIIRAFEDVFLVGYVKQYFKSHKKREISKSKVYLFDTAYITFLSKESEDYGRIFENVVFVELFRRQKDIENKNIFYYRSDADKECDFIVKNRETIEAIQVCYSLNEKNRAREIGGLLSALEKFDIKEGTIITLDQQEEIKINNKTLKVIPAWKWMLGV
ncbi:MAG: ATP-binding protein [Nanoarchaeota archaeon]